MLSDVMDDQQHRSHSWTLYQYHTSIPMWSLLLLHHLLVNHYKLKVWNWTWKSCQNKRVGLYLMIDWKWGGTKIPSFQAHTRVHLHWNVGLPNLQANTTCGLPFNVDLNLTNDILIDLNTILPLVTITILLGDYVYITFNEWKNNQLLQLLITQWVFL
jgi:hypothetical protein